MVFPARQSYISRTGAEYADVTYLASLQVFSDHFVPLWSTGLGRTLLWFLCGPTRCPKMAVYQVLSGLKAVCQGLLFLFFIRNAYHIPTGAQIIYPEVGLSPPVTRLVLSLENLATLQTLATAFGTKLASRYDFPFSSSGNTVQTSRVPRGWGTLACCLYSQSPKFSLSLL